MIACGLTHCIAVDKDNQVYAWGSNQFGQLGMKTQEQYSSTPVHVEAYLNAGVV